MPFKDYLTAADYDSDYDVGAEGRWGHPGTRPEIRLHYHRMVLYPYFQARAVGIATAMGWTAPGPKLVVVGAGFSWLAESFENDLGFTTVIGIDTSPYIAAEQTNTEEAVIDAAITGVGLNPATGEGLARKNLIYSDPGPRTRASRGVLNENAQGNQSRGRIKSALDLRGNDTPDWLLSERMIENMTDAEVVQASVALAGWGVPLAHLVQPSDAENPNEPGVWNGKTMVEWKLLLPADTFIHTLTFEVL